jgi:hypothetical protein
MRNLLPHLNHGTKGLICGGEFGYDFRENSSKYGDSGVFLGAVRP